jgi:hypothetical protein
MKHFKTITSSDLDSVTGGWISGLMQKSWDRQAERQNNASKDPTASTSKGPGKPLGTFSGGLRNLLSGFGM